MSHATLLPLLAVLLSAGTSVTAQTTRPATQPTQPTMVELPAMELAGIACFGSPDKGLFADLWHHFPKNVDNQPGLATVPCYGVSLAVPEMQTKHQWSYLVAGQITEAAKVPQYLLRLPLPAGTYAVFRLKQGMPDGLKELGPLFDYIHREWLPASGYEAAPLDIERYNSKDNVIDVLVPVKKK